MSATTLTRIDFHLSEELLAAVDAAAGKGGRNALIEEVLWSSKRIRNAAKTAGVTKPTRPTRGRPRRES